MTETDEVCSCHFLTINFPIIIPGISRGMKSLTTFAPTCTSVPEVTGSSSTSCPRISTGPFSWTSWRSWPSRSSRATMSQWSEESSSTGATASWKWCSSQPWPPTSPKTTRAKSQTTKMRTESMALLWTLLLTTFQSAMRASSFTFENMYYLYLEMLVHLYIAFTT